MKILLCITSLGVGGAERLVTDMADFFTKEGHEVAIIFLTGSADLLPKNSEIPVVGLSINANPLSILSAFLKFRRILLEFQPDVVNSHLVHANIFTRLARLFSPIRRLISSAHNTNEEGRLRIFAYRITDGLADISTNVSREAVEALESQGAVCPGRMIPVLNGIDTDRFDYISTSRCILREALGLPLDSQVVLSVGRLTPQKDYPNLLRSFASLDLKPFLLIAGDGPLLGGLMTLSSELNLSDRVFFLGNRTDIPELMSACDVFVLSSAWEGFGLVVAEAMACRRVVVATDSGGVREVLGEEGFLVPVRDHVSLSKAINRAFLLSSEQRAALGDKARSRIVRKFSFDSMSTHYLSLYQDN